MKAKKFNIKNVLTLIGLLSLIFVSESKRSLATTNEPIAIDTEFNKEVITGTYSLDEDYNYYYYKIQESTKYVENYNTFTIVNPGNDTLEVQCLLTSNLYIDEIADKFTNKTCQVYQSKKSEMVNVVYGLSEFKADQTKNLVIRIKGTVGKALTFYFRKQKSYQTSLEDQTITNAFAYICFSVSMSSYLKLVNANQYFFESPNVDSFHVYGSNSTGNELLNLNGFLMITNQTLAAYYLPYDSIMVFMGKKNTTSSDAANTIEISHILIPNEGDKIMYYKTNGIDTENQLTFHRECSSKHDNYLAVDYTEESDDFYVTVNTLQGSSAVAVADTFSDKLNIYDLEYRTVKGLAKINKNNYHFHVYKVQCESTGTSIILNLKYNKKKEVKSLTVEAGYLSEGLFSFSSGNSLNINYKGASELKIELFLLDSDEKQDFSIKFESKTLDVSNKRKIYLNRTIASTNDLTISGSSTAYVIASASVGNTGTEESSMIFQDETGVYFTSLSRRYNYNYGGSIGIKNKDGKPKRVCYYLSEVATFQTKTKNCVVLTTQSTLTFSKLLLKETSDDDYLSKDYNYRFYIMIFEAELKDLSFNPLEVITDLPKSTVIKLQGNDYIYATGDIKKDEPSYFSRTLSKSIVDSDESLLNIYLGDDDSKEYEDVNYKIQCVLGYEIAIKYIENLFTDDDNICHVINTEEKNPKILHVLVNYSQYYEITDRVVNLLIKFTADKDITARFLVRDESSILKNLIVNKDNKRTIIGPEAYSAYNLTFDSLKNVSKKQLMFYNNETDSVKIYARNKYQFKFVDRGSLLVLKYKDAFYKFNNYSSFLVLFGRVGCNLRICSSNFNITLQNNIFYHSLQKEFTDSFHAPVYIQNSADSTKYAFVFNYYKKPSQDVVYLSKSQTDGEALYVKYVDQLNLNNYDKLKLINSNEIQEIKALNQHTSIVKFQCRGDFYMTLYYFLSNDYSDKNIILVEGTVREFVLPQNKTYTYSYKGINDIKIDLLSSVKTPKITFELKDVSMDGKSVKLTRKNKEVDVFKVENPSDTNVTVIRITTSLNMDNFKNTTISGLYKYKGAFIYEVPKNAETVNFKIKLNKKLRNLVEENNTSSDDDGDVRVCYNGASEPLLEKNEANCFYATDNSNFTYHVPESLADDKSYVVLYTNDDDADKFDVEDVDVKIGENKKKNSSDDGGSSGWIVFIIILIILILLGAFIVIFLIISKKKQRVTSQDIENDIKEPTSMESAPPQ